MKNSFESFKERALSTSALKNVFGGIQSSGSAGGASAGPQTIRCGAFYADADGGGFSEVGECAHDNVHDCMSGLLTKYSSMGLSATNFGCV